MSIGGEKRYIHQLVAEAWYGPRPDALQALHQDDDPGNTSASNIRWDTPAANYADAVRNGRIRTKAGRDLADVLMEPVSNAQLRQRDCDGHHRT